MSLAEKLVSLRKKKGLTQMDLAERLDVSRQAISRWEVGSSAPSTDNLKVLSELYGVSVDYLLRDDANEYYANTQNLEQEQSIKLGIIKNRTIFICLFAAFLVVGIIVCSMVSQRQKQEIVIPIGELDSVIDDHSSAVSFPVG